MSCIKGVVTELIFNCTLFVILVLWIIFVCVFHCLKLEHGNSYVAETIYFLFLTSMILIRMMNGLYANYFSEFHLIYV